MRVDELPAFVHRADAVGVAVGSQAKAAHAAADGPRQRAQVAPDRFGVHAAKAGVHLAADFEDLAAGALQDAADHAASRAVHGIDDNARRVGGDDVEVDHLAQVIVVGRDRVEAQDALFGDGVLVLHQVRDRGLCTRCR